MADANLKRAHNQSYYARNKASIDAKNKLWREANPEKVRASARHAQRRKYGMCPVEAEKVWNSTTECGICGKERQRIDHDHKTGTIRGALCHGCNVGLGFFSDDPEILRAAAEYLEKNSGRR